MMLKCGIVTSVHTKVTFQALMNLNTGWKARDFCAHFPRGGVAHWPRTERHALLFEVRTRTHARGNYGFSSLERTLRYSMQCVRFARSLSIMDTCPINITLVHAHAG